MAFQNPNQHGWQDDGPLITTPPTLPPVITVQPGIPMVQLGVPHGQVVISGQPGVPIQAQPGGWPMPNSNCPPGLEYLMTLDKLIVDQQVELLEVITGWETENKYIVKDSRGQVVYYAAEESNCCDRMCWGKNRPFEIRIVDVTMKEVIRLTRPLRSSKCSCCSPYWLQEMEVFSNGVKIGSVVQNWTFFIPSFTVYDANGDSVLTIKQPCYSDSIFDFKVLSPDGKQKVGKISKEWSGILREFFTDADKFGISFPADLDVKIKAVLLGACFLIDFMYFKTDDGGCLPFP